MALSKITPESINLASDFAGMGFGGTGAANQLDDYEEGTWTPVLAFGQGSTGITYANQTARYIKIGSMVYIRFGIRLTNKGSSTGTAEITGLPFTVEPISYCDATTSSLSTSGMSGLTSTVFGVFANNQTYFSLYDSGSSGSTSLSEANFSNSTFVFGIGFYNVGF